MDFSKPDLRQLLYADSEINAYNAINPSLTTTDTHFPKDNISITGDSSDTHSQLSYATTVVSDHSHQTAEDANKPARTKSARFRQIHPQNQQNANTNFQNPQFTRTISSDANKARPTIKDSFARQVYLDTTEPKRSPSPQPTSPGGLAQKLNVKRIRESMEFDLNASYRSNGSSGIPSIRSSQIARQSVITLKMFSHNPKNQIRLKLYLPLTTAPNCETQIIVLFVNKGSTMKICKDFVEEKYPYNLLQGKIRQLCIADEDGDIDDDFPPIHEDQDITSLGVQNFYVDRIFEGKESKNSRRSSTSVLSTESKKSNLYKPHRDTIKESLLSPSPKSITHITDHSDNRRRGCCWCCCGSRRYAQIEDSEDHDELNGAPDEDPMGYNGYQGGFSGASTNKTANASPIYRPPAKSTASGPEKGVQYASL